MFRTIQQPAVVTIASIEGDNKIVATSVVSGGQTLTIEPSDAMFVPSPADSMLPSDEIVPTTPTSDLDSVSTSAVDDVATVSSTVSTGSEAPEKMEDIEILGNILKPGLLPVPVSVDQEDTTDEPAIAPVEETEISAGDISSSQETSTSSSEDKPEEVNTATEIMPSMDDFSEIFPTSSYETVEETTETDTNTEVVEASVLPEQSEKTTSYGVTSVIMGPEETFTTYVSRVESEDRTAVSTIVEQQTQVNYVEPATVTSTTATAIVDNSEEVEESEKDVDARIKPTVESEESPVWPPFVNQPFNPPEEPAVIARPTSKPATSSAQETPVVKEVQEDKHNVLLGGFGRPFGVDQPPVSGVCHGKCKGKLEVCVPSDGAPECLCKPGYSRNDPSDECTSKFID